MILDLKNQEEFPATIEQTAESLATKPDREDVLGVENVRANLTVQHADEEYFCQGKISADFKLECARCLSEFVTKIGGKTDFIIRHGRPTTRDDREIPDDEEYVDLLDDLTADISYIVSQTLSLGLPMKPICKDDCQGLCPACGINRNDKKCDCKTEQIDERWEGLQGLF